MTAHVASILLLLFLTGTLFLGRPFLVRRIRTIFWLSVAAIGLTLIYESVEVYFKWLADPGAGHFLLPPSTPINYFIFYVYARILLPYLISLAIAGVAFLASKYTNIIFDERFFYPEEYYFLSLGIFLSGHPFWLGYAAICCVIYLAYSVVSAARSSNGSRVSLYYAWLPVALLLAAATNFFNLSIPLLNILRVS